MSSSPPPSSFPASPAPPATSDPARLFALVPCAGSGSRAGTAQPKQYEMLAGRPMVRHTLAALAQVARLQKILVVVSRGDAALADLTEPFEVADCGGATRAGSVANGLQRLQALGARDEDWVLVHDAARCLVTPAIVDRLIDACRTDAVGGLLAHRLADTLKAAVGEAGRARSAVTVDRSDKWLAQTPQMFRLGLLQRALREAGPQVTDEASAVEALGLKPLLVEGGAQNFKLTYPEDFALAEAVLRSRTA